MTIDNNATTDNIAPLKHNFAFRREILTQQ